MKWLTFYLMDKFVKFLEYTYNIMVFYIYMYRINDFNLFLGEDIFYECINLNLYLKNNSGHT